MGEEINIHGSTQHATMKEAIIHAGPKVEIIDSAIPKAKPGQVVIKVAYSGSNPKDWKVSEWMPDLPPANQGDDIAGVTEFKKGDRVAAFHEMLQPHGSYAEYAVAWAHTTFFLPEKTSFEEGAAIPLAALTAAVGLYANDRLDLPRRLRRRFRSRHVRATARSALQH